jgi:hypothetical protein
MSSHPLSTVPGCRTPHVRRADSNLLDDAMGPEFTFPGFDPAVDVVLLQAAARKRKVPLKILDVERPGNAIFHFPGLVLSRPDRHVAWRGDRMPADPLALNDRVRGAANWTSKAGMRSRRA